MDQIGRARYSLVPWNVLKPVQLRALCLLDSAVSSNIRLISAASDVHLTCKHAELRCRIQHALHVSILPRPGPSCDFALQLLLARASSPSRLAWTTHWKTTIPAKAEGCFDHTSHGPRSTYARSGHGKLGFTPRMFEVEISSVLGYVLQTSSGCPWENKGARWVGT